MRWSYNRNLLSDNFLLVKYDNLLYEVVLSKFMQNKTLFTYKKDKLTKNLSFSSLP